MFNHQEFEISIFIVIFSEAMGGVGGSTTRLVESSRQLFLTCISLVYTIAFTSFYMQAPGLVGKNGVTPAYINVNRPAKGTFERFVNNPSVLYLLSGTGLSVDEGE